MKILYAVTNDNCSGWLLVIKKLFPEKNCLKACALCKEATMGFGTFKGTVQPDWIYMKVVPLDALKRTSTAIGF
jgi:hypothetical protein